MLFVMIPFLSDLFPKRKLATSNYIRNCNAGSPQVEEALANVELGAIVLLLSKRWFQEAPRLARRAMEIEKQFPDLLHRRPARRYRKLLKAYARSEFWGKLAARYYLLTRKIK